MKNLILNNFKKISYSILAVLFSFILLSGCGLKVETAREHNNRLSEEIESLKEDIQEVTDNTGNSTTAISDTASANTNIISDNTTAATNSASVNDISDIKKTTVAKNTFDSNTTAATTLKNNNTVKKTTIDDKTVSSETTSLKTEPDKNITVTLIISCKNILSEGTVNINGKECTDGIILNKKYSIGNNNNVFELLLSACKQNNLSLKYTMSSYGAYVSSIADIAEKEYGTYSGWMYMVNNIPPNKGCQHYIPEDGDIIEFYYVTKIG